jgi:hypothetical protein
MRPLKPQYTTPEPTPEELKKEVYGAQNWINKYSLTPNTKTLTILMSGCKDNGSVASKNTNTWAINGQTVSGEIEV